MPNIGDHADGQQDTRVIGHNIQAAVDTHHHLIVAHEVTNIGNARSQLGTMVEQAQAGTQRGRVHPA